MGGADSGVPEAAAQLVPFALGGFTIEDEVLHREPPFVQRRLCPREVFLELTVPESGFFEQSEQGRAPCFGKSMDLLASFG